MFLNVQNGPCASGKGAAVVQATKGIVKNAAEVILSLWADHEAEIRRGCADEHGRIDKEELLGYLLCDTIIGELSPRIDARAVGHKASKLVWAKPPKKPPLAAELASIRKATSRRRSRLPPIDQAAAEHAAADAAEVEQCAALLDAPFELPLPSSRRCSAVAQAKRRRDSLTPEEQLLIAESEADRAEKRAAGMRELKAKHGMGSCLDQVACERVYRRVEAETAASIARRVHRVKADAVEHHRATDRAIHALSELGLRAQAARQQAQDLQPRAEDLKLLAAAIEDGEEMEQICSDTLVEASEQVRGEGSGFFSEPRITIQEQEQILKAFERLWADRMASAVMAAARTGCLTPSEHIWEVFMWHAEDLIESVHKVGPNSGFVPQGLGISDVSE